LGNALGLPFAIAADALTGNPVTLDIKHAVVAVQSHRAQTKPTIGLGLTLRHQRTGTGTTGTKSAVQGAKSDLEQVSRYLTASLNSKR
jgi:hypothetical protein